MLPGPMSRWTTSMSSRDFYVLTERVAGFPSFGVQFADGSSTRTSSFRNQPISPLPATTPSSTPTNFRYNYQSLVTPPLGVRLRRHQHTSPTLLKQNEVPGGFDRNNYVSERVFATASDGTASRSRSSTART